ncbi:hypothetical protein U1Q18_048869 [Sarracenia purpurea var. burkii]
MRAAARMSPARWAALCDGRAMGGAVHAMGNAKRRACDGRRSVQRSTSLGRRRALGVQWSGGDAQWWWLVVLHW